MDLLLWVEDAANIFAHSANIGLRAAALFCSSRNSPQRPLVAPSRTKIAALSITIHVLTVVISWCVVRSILAPAQFEQMFLLVPPVALITMLPVSIAGWGLREASMMLAFGYSGLNPANGTMVSLLTGVTSFISSVPSAGWSGSSVGRRLKRTWQGFQTPNSANLR